MTKFEQIVSQAERLGACDSAITALRTHSFAQLRDYEGVLDFIAWASDRDLIPPHFYETYETAIAAARETLFNDLQAWFEETV